MTPNPVLPTITLDGLLKFWQFIGVPMFGAVVYYVRDIGKQLRALNGRLIRLEAWSLGHEQYDRDFHDTTKRELDQIQRRFPGHTGGP